MCVPFKATMPAGKLPSCKYLGNPNFGTTSNPINRQWSLYDPTDPGRGVSLTYTGGQHCSNGQQRALQINFLCSKREIEKIDQVEKNACPPSPRAARTAPWVPHRKALMLAGL